MVVATGFFDGVHVGHRLVIAQLVQAAKNRGDESMVVTFWPHPRTVLQQEARSLRLLTSMSEKKALLKDLGVDRVEVIPFTKEFGALTAREYFEKYLIGRYGAKAIVLGYDNRMGSDARNASEVRRTAEDAGLDVIWTEKVVSGHGLDVSSTKIRDELERGGVVKAAQMLGYDYSLFGVVVSGERIGSRVLGFPTANMQLYEPLKLVPANGVYFVKVDTVGREFYGMCNIGNRPTVREGNARTIETNIFDFGEDIYGLDIRLTFLRRIREEIRFSSFTQLEALLARDKFYCMTLKHRAEAGSERQDGQ